MTNPSTTPDTRLSDEQVAETVAWCRDRKAQKPWYGEGDDSPKMLTTVDYLLSILTELQALRASAEAGQSTTCAVCLQNKPTPLRRDEMGGYVCLTCVEKRLDAHPLRNPSPSDGEISEAMKMRLTEYDKAVRWHSYRPHDVNREAHQHRAAAQLAEAVRAALTEQS